MALDLLKVGDVAPGFSLKNHKNEEVSLDEFKDKNIVMWFFPKANTPG